MKAWDNNTDVEFVANLDGQKLNDIKTVLDNNNELDDKRIVNESVSLLGDVLVNTFGTYVKSNTTTNNNKKFKI